MKERAKPFNYPMFLIICVLLCIGLVTLASASSYSALNDYQDSLYYFKRQIIFAVVGVAIMLAVSKFDYSRFKKFPFLTFAFGIILLGMVFVPGLGKTVNGARRWINLGFTTFQPSEIMKIIIVISASAYIVKHNLEYKGHFIKLYGPIFLMMLCVFGIMYFQNHMSGMLVIAVAVVSVIWASGIKITPKIIFVIVLLALVLVGWLLSSDFRRQRLLSFFNGEDDIRGSNWQATQSKYAIGTGGVFGLGLGQSRQKYLWLPEAQNDFIFSILAEETGLVGTTAIIIVFGAFIVVGFKIAIKCKDMFGMLLATRNNVCVCISNNYKYMCCNMYNTSNWYATSIF